MAIGIGFDALYFAEHFALLVIIALAWHGSAGQWRTLYRRLLFAAAVYQGGLNELGRRVRDYHDKP